MCPNSGMVHHVRRIVVDDVTIFITSSKQTMEIHPNNHNNVFDTF